MQIDLQDNQMAYIVKNGRIVPIKLPDFGKVVISTEAGKVVRISKEETTLIK